MYRRRISPSARRMRYSLVNPDEESSAAWTHSLIRGASSGRTRARKSSTEPANVPGKVYAQVAARAVGAIRKADPDRLIIADGMQWGREPVPELIPLGIAQSTRGYDPMKISHYQASWIGGSEQWPVPTWPLNSTNGWPTSRPRL